MLRCREFGRPKGRDRFTDIAPAPVPMAHPAPMHHAARRRRCRAARALLLAAALAGATGASPAGPPQEPAAPPAEDAGPAVPVGEMTLRGLLAASPSWQRSDRGPDRGAVEALRGARRGWALEVVYGHWCSDSEREIPRLIALLGALGPDAPPVRWVAVDRAKREPAAVVRRLAIERVPTIVVSRDGRELGRIVERADSPLERALAAIVRPGAASRPAAPRPSHAQP